VNNVRLEVESVSPVLPHPILSVEWLVPAPWSSEEHVLVGLSYISLRYPADGPLAYLLEISKVQIRSPLPCFIASARPYVLIYSMSDLGNPTPAWLNTGDNAWQLTAASLVALQSIPGLCVLYAGLVHRRWVINSMMMVPLLLSQLDHRALLTEFPGLLRLCNDTHRLGPCGLQSRIR
jgi:hypothetical protein